MEERKDYYKILGIDKNEGEHKWQKKEIITRSSA